MWQIKSFYELDNLTLFQILKERVNVFVVEQECPYPEIDDNDLISDHLYQFDENKKLMGYLRIFDTEKYVKFGRILTSKAYRGQGIGDQLLEQAKEFALNKYGKKDIYLEAQVYAQGYYQKHGFQTVGNSYLEDNIPHIVMIYHYQ